MIESVDCSPGGSIISITNTLYGWMLCHQHAIRLAAKRKQPRNSVANLTAILAISANFPTPVQPFQQRHITSTDYLWFCALVVSHATIKATWLVKMIDAMQTQLVTATSLTPVKSFKVVFPLDPHQTSVSQTTGWKSLSEKEMQSSKTSRTQSNANFLFDFKTKEM